MLSKKQPNILIFYQHVTILWTKLLIRIQV